MIKTEKELKSKLLPCPFCSSEAKVIEQQELVDRQPIWRVECSNELCNPRPFTFRADKEADARKAWNNQLEVLKLVNALEVIVKTLDDKI